MKNLLSLQEHAYKLSKVIAQIPEHTSKVSLQWSLAGEWLHLGSSIDSINVITEKFDDTIMYCSPAIEYENEKSKTLGCIIKELSIFNFYWGAFETVGKIIDPPKVPNTLKKRRTLIDDSLYYLKNNYPLIHAPNTYNKLLHCLECILSKDPQYLHINFETALDYSYFDNTGKGLALIRMIRNDFAHGSHSFPEPDDWNLYGNFKSSDYLKKIHISSRLLLLTIQMLLISFFKDKQFSILEWGISDNYVNVIENIFTLHLTNPPTQNYGLFYSIQKE